MLHSELRTPHSELNDMGARDAVFIIGAGHFGGRAARLLADASKGPVFVVDRDAHRLAEVKRPGLRLIVDDGIGFLVRNYDGLHTESTIVPALPIHLAYEWLKLSLREAYIIHKADMPVGVEPLLPHTWHAGDGSLLVSFADYLCPDDCPEPEYCTVTGERRDPALHDLLRRLDVPDVQVHVIRSHQLAPGLGGYKTAVLRNAAERVTASVPGRWLLGTACRCHGVLTSFEILQALTEARKT